MEQKKKIWHITDDERKKYFREYYHNKIRSNPEKYEKFRTNQKNTYRRHHPKENKPPKPKTISIRMTPAEFEIFKKLREQK